MILRKQPESVSSIKKNFIVHFSSSKSGIENHTSPLSVKCVLNGEEKYKTKEGNYLVNSGTYLIINNGQECESNVNNEAESFSIYFDSKFANRALQSIVTPSDKLLNVSFLPDSQPVHFFEKIYSHNKIITPVIMKLKLASNFNYENDDWLDEQFYEMLQKLLILHRNLYGEIEKLPPVKFSTKTELYKRACRAKEFIDATFTKNIPLDEIAREACISKFHFIRVFKTVYKHTPHQYIMKKRFDLAMNLVRKTEMPISEICYSIGFESVGTFSYLFKNKFGLSPEAARNYSRQFMTKLALARK